MVVVGRNREKGGEVVHLYYNLTTVQARYY